MLEQPAEDHGIRDVRDEELIKADDLGAAGDAGSNDAQRIFLFLELAKLGMHPLHEAMEMQAQLLLEGQGEEELVHQEGLAPAHAAPHVDAAGWPALCRLAAEALPDALQHAGLSLDQSLPDAVQFPYGVLLRGIRCVAVRGQRFSIASRWGDRFHSVGLQFGNVAELFQRLRVGERVGVLHRLAVDDVLYREFHDLAADGARNVPHLDDLRRNVARRGVGADDLANALSQSIVQRQAFAQPHEQHDALVALPALAHGDGFQHFLELLHLAIDLRGADAYAAGVEGGIRTAVDDHAVVLGEFREITMAPGVLEA